MYRRNQGLVSKKITLAIRPEVHIIIIKRHQKVRFIKEKLMSKFSARCKEMINAQFF